MTMTILIDPSEAKKGTRLPQSIMDQSILLPGLESVTGGDLLITTVKAPMDIRMLKDVDSFLLQDNNPGISARDLSIPLPSALIGLQFKKACNNGLLVQRKTSYDLASSVPEYSRILAKMLRWTDRPWLLFVGDLKADKNGAAIIDGNRALKGFSYNAVQGALEAWQDRGGRITFLSRDSLLAPWVARQLDKLRAPKTEKVLPPRTIAQPIIGPDSGGKPWRSTLMSFPNMGMELANRVAEGNATLTSCLEWITCPDWLERVSTSRPKGIGVPTVRKWRGWLGLNEDCLQLLVAAMPPGYEGKVELHEVTRQTSHK